MANIVYGVVHCLLLLTAVKATNAQPKQIISVDGIKRILCPTWWNKAESNSVEDTLDGMELYNSTVVVVNHKCKCKGRQESSADVLYNPQCPNWFPPQMAHADVEMTFMTLSDVITQQKK